MTKGKVTGVVGNLVTVEVDGPVGQNEICYIKQGDTTLMSEVIKITNKIAYTQVYESTRGLKVGTEVEFTEHMLEVELGPGLLSKNFDGLQSDLDKKDGVFLKRGEYTPALDEDVKFKFSPIAKVGETVKASDWLGGVKEGWVDHKIMVPFKLDGKYTVKSIVSEGEYTVYETIAVLTDENGEDIKVNMTQKWPVKRAVKNYKEKPRPSKIMETGVRVIDIFNPMTEGGTGFIPGPFGCGKTVLQHAISKNAEADIIIFAACGERANEVVEIFTEFPELVDPRTGRKLMERTLIICNTSNMPVAAREASVYTAMTIAEYYRQMGLKVLLLADSTSRWAQALREMSNRLEELPGQDAFPMDLPATISSFYSRAGMVYLNNNTTGSVTFIGTVSPAGGNLKEPVTESTKKAARCFYALQQARADSKRYPAVDPIDSYSKYLEYPEVQEYFTKNVSDNWVELVLEAKNWVLRGKETKDQMDILGDDGVPVDYHITFWKAELIDFILMQQDAFDAIDSITPFKRQKFMLEFVMSVCDIAFQFETFESVAPFFKDLVNVFKQMNYSKFESDDFYKYETQIKNLIETRRAK